jgi:flagellar basal body-associated protein FliL
MAKDNDAEERKDPQRQEPDETSNKEGSAQSSAGGRWRWIIVGVVAALGAGAGFGLGRFLGPGSAAAKSAQQAGTVSAQLVKEDASEAGSEKGWYFDLEPVVANLNEPSATRYVRVALTLEISTALDQKKTTAFLQEKTPLLKNWLTIYLASQTIEDMRGDRNLRRIQLEILDSFNEKLFPDASPHIKGVLFKEFAIQ